MKARLVLMPWLPLLLSTTGFVCNASRNKASSLRNNPNLQHPSNIATKPTRRLQRAADQVPIPPTIQEVPFNPDGAIGPEMEEGSGATQKIQARVIFRFNGLHVDRIMNEFETPMYESVVKKFLKHELEQRSALFITTVTSEAQSVFLAAGKSVDGVNIVSLEVVTLVLAEHNAPPDIVLDLKIVDVMERNGLQLARHLSAASNFGGYFWRVSGIQVLGYNVDGLPNVSSIEQVRPEIIKSQGVAQTKMVNSEEPVVELVPNAAPYSAEATQNEIVPRVSNRGYGYVVSNADEDSASSPAAADDDIYETPPQQSAPEPIQSAMRVSSDVDAQNSVVLFVAIIVATGFLMSIMAVLVLKTTRKSRGQNKKIDQEEVLVFANRKKSTGPNKGVRFKDQEKDHFIKAKSARQGPASSRNIV